MNILFLDDHKIFRDGLVSLIKDEEFCRKIISCSTVDDAIKILENNKLDILIMDINLENESGFKLLDYLKNNKINLKIICLSMHEELEYLQEALALGVMSYVTKSAGYSELKHAILNVIEDNIYFDQKILKTLVNSLLFQVKKTSHMKVLTTREEEIFILLSKENTVEDISEKLFISSKTVENHRTSIYRKLGIKDRLSLIKIANERSF